MGVRNYEARGVGLKQILMCSTVFLLLHYSSVSAYAQTASKWQNSVELNISPTLGKEVAGGNAGEDRDYSEYELKVSTTKDNAIFGNDINFAAHVVYDPDQFGDEVESHIQFDAIIGKQKYLAHRGRLFSRDVKSTDNTWQPWAQLSISQVWDGVFSGDGHFDTSILAGVVYTNVAYKVRSADAQGRPVYDKGLYFKATATVERLWSSRESTSRWSPKISATVYGRLRSDAIRPFARAEYEVRLFDMPALGMSQDRIDHRLKFTAGVDIAPWLGGSVDAFEIAGLFFRRRSNAPNGDFSRAYFAPALTLSKNF